MIPDEHFNAIGKFPIHLQELIQAALDAEQRVAAADMDRSSRS